MTLRRVVIDDNAIVSSLFYNNAVKEAFPFIKAFADRYEQSKGSTGGCGGCNRSAGIDYNGLKAAIAGMSSDDQLKFKTLIGAGSVRVIYMAGKGQIDTTF